MARWEDNLRSLEVNWYRFDCSGSAVGLTCIILTNFNKQIV